MRYLIFCACVWTVVQSGNATSEMISVNEVPAITKSLHKLEQTSMLLTSVLPYEDLMVTDVRRHYVIVVGVLSCVVEYLNSDCTPPDYEHEYLPAIDRLFPIIWLDPKSAVEKIGAFVDDVNQEVDVIKKLIDFYCKGKSEIVCDKMIYVMSLQSKTYKRAFDILMDGSELADLFEKLVQKDVVNNYGEVALLINGQEAFKPLVMKAAKIYNIMYGVSCQP